MSQYIGERAVLVYGPIGRRKDGKWSRRKIIHAAFADPMEAEIYIELKLLAGIPVGVKGKFEEAIRE